MSKSIPTDFIFCIADIERETGLHKDTLRVWERRYGFPSPLRDGRGDRRYDEEQLSRLKLIKRLLDGGFRPGSVVNLAMNELLTLINGTKSAPVKSTHKLHKRTEAESSISPKWLDWLCNNEIDQFRRGIQQHLICHGLAHTIHSLIAPLAVQVGDAWHAGRLSIFQEHLFSEIIQVILREAIVAISASSSHAVRRPRVLLTTPPNEHHVSGLLMAECIFALEGCERISIGANTPVSEIIGATRQVPVDIVALSFSSYSTAREVGQVLWQLDEQLAPGIQVWVGGSARALQSRRNLPPEVVLVRHANDLTKLVARWRNECSMEMSAQQLDR
ncbi:MAG: MerR family transcriptional regulator [Candidatus Aquirickettsiella gammari]